jgi:type II secretory pathway pseudopilin PulG
MTEKYRKALEIKAKHMNACGEHEQLRVALNTKILLNLPKITTISFSLAVGTLCAWSFLYRQKKGWELQGSRRASAFNLRKGRGFSLLGVLVGLSITVVLSLAMAQVFKFSSQQLLALKSQNDLIDLRRYIAFQLDCSQTLKNETTWQPDKAVELRNRLDKAIFEKTHYGLYRVGNKRMRLQVKTGAKPGALVIRVRKTDEANLVNLFPSDFPVTCAF